MAKSQAEAIKLPKEKIDPNVLKVALILVFGAIASQLDSTMVNVAINTLASDLHSTVSAIQWVITGYVLTMGLAVPVSGWAIQRFGGKNVYIFSLWVFLISSVLCSLAWDTGSLIGFRLIQGVGAGLLIPTMQNVLVQSAGGRNLGRLVAIISIPALLGPILGPVIGGLIMDNMSWRWIFYVNIPIMLVALWLSWKHIPRDEPSQSKPRLDTIGLLLLSPAFAVLIYGISKIGSQGGLFSAGVLVPLTAGIVLLAAYIMYALRTSQTPLLDLHLFRSRHFMASNVTLFLSGMVMNGALLLLPLYYEQVRGESVLMTGLLLIPQGVGMLITRNWIGGLADRMGARSIVLVSLVVTLAASIPFAFAGTDTNYFWLSAAQLVRGAALNGILIPIMVSAYEGLRKEQIPHASISTRIFQTIGGAFGSAVLATVIGQQVARGTAASLTALAHAYQVAFWWSVGFAAISFIPAMFMSSRRKEREL
ncbi:MDR family MFS transporter [Paenibacillus whitsoniae]|uniref:DHA2 family efflux MFS transporter permease subunit n=1 Tax=Paenibacillus whitsoniae TaxID=2496558 RepID=A0A430JG46_9BACL|nr:MDR family MFS transporter [Paenibacillus whitsoniae]RTE09999.1 DHA2 family efflux MFS transporter permease subunit [Paenibacillus whitsoniae]